MVNISDSAIAELINVPFVILNEKGIIISVNQEFLDLSGKKRPAVLKKKIDEIILSKFTSGLSSFISKLVLDLPRNYRQIILNTYSSAEYKIKAKVVPEKNIFYVYLIFHKQNNPGEYDKFKNAVEQTTDSIFITNRGGFIEYVNPAFENMTGFSGKEAVGNTPKIIKSGIHKKDFYLNLWKTIVAGKNWRASVVNRKKNGDLIYVDHTITPIKNSEGKIIKFVGIWKDITQHKILESKKDEFISVASHELKTPLTTIKAYSDLITARIKDRQDTQVIGYFKKMNSQVNKLKNLVYQLLDTTRLSHGKLKLVKEKFDLINLLTMLASDISAVYGNRVIKVEARGINTVYADKNRLSEVINNLLTNAIKYSEDTREIIVRGYKNNGNNIISIQDYGSGIPREFIKKIFERYFSWR